MAFFKVTIIKNKHIGKKLDFSMIEHILICYEENDQNNSQNNSNKSDLCSCLQSS